jgi:hypothetical protein
LSCSWSSISKSVSVSVFVSVSSSQPQNSNLLQFLMCPITLLELQMMTNLLLDHFRIELYKAIAQLFCDTSVFLKS